MRITGIRATPVAVPYRADEVWAFGRRRGQISVLIEVDTDEGIVGIGEAAAYPSVEIVLAVLKTIEPLVIGADPGRIEALIRRIDLVGTWHHVRATSPAIAAVEMACWDIVGKTCDQPLVNLFGGPFTDEVEFFYYVARTDPDEVRAEGRRAAQHGFRTCYLKVAAGDISAGMSADLDRIAALADGAGPDVRIRVDANEALSPGAAVRFVRQLAEFPIELVEQPVSGRNLTEMAYLRERIDFPLLANEASWTRYDQLEVIRRSAADVLSADNQLDGGLLNLKRSAGICEAAGLPVIKHSLGELGVALAAATHVLASTPNFRYANQAYPALLSDDITVGFGGGVENYRDGRLSVTTAPGIGVEIDHDKVAKYAELYRTDRDGFAFGDTDAIRHPVSIPKA